MTTLRAHLRDRATRTAVLIGAAGEGVVPTGVLVRYEGETAVRHRGERAVGDALEFVFNGADNGVAQVSAFCSGGAR